MEKIIKVKIAGKETELVIEALPLSDSHSLWQLLTTVKVGPDEKVYARKGDLIRVTKQTQKKGIKEIYSVYNLSTLRRAESIHIKKSVASVCRLIDYWAPRLGYVIGRLKDWLSLKDDEKEQIRTELRNFVGAFYGAKAWQKALALEKVMASTEIRDRLNRLNPQGIIGRLASAKIHLLEYRRGLDKALGKNAVQAVLVERINSEYRRRFAEVRKLIQLGYSTNAAVSQGRIAELREILRAFTINPWYRPAAESLKYLDTSEVLYENGDRRGANKILRMIPALFSAESRLTRVVEMIHRVFDLGASLDEQGCNLAGDIIYPKIGVMERLEADVRVVSYQPLASDVAYYLAESEMCFRAGKVRLARSYLRQVEIRIRGKEV